MVFSPFPLLFSMCVPRPFTRPWYVLDAGHPSSEQTHMHLALIPYTAKLSLTHQHKALHTREHTQRSSLHTAGLRLNTLGTPQNASAHVGQARFTAHASVGTS